MLPKCGHENQAILLSHATECLAKAAVALSDAAEAVAAAAKSFIPDTEVTSTTSTPRSPKPVEENTETNSVLDPGLDWDSSSTADSLPTPTKHTNNSQRAPEKLDEFEPEDTREQSVSGVGDYESLGAQSTLHGNNNLTANYAPAIDTAPETETKTQPPSGYRILLDNEADVFLTVCYLIRQGRKAVCYVRSSITALDVYKELLSAVEVPVHIIKSFSPQEIERAVKTFHDDDRSVLVLPATHSPSFRINEPNSWVVHAGWPVNEQLYEQQITAHQAKNNVFVAYSGDIDVYPSSSKILASAQPWPRDEQLFKKGCTTLRPSFNKKLDEIPLAKKAKVYLDWIAIHAATGPYHPPSWTPSILVYRANLYITKVLKYKTSGPSGVQVFLPEVSTGFVGTHKLQSAVEEGILRVKSSAVDDRVPPLPHSGPIPIVTEPSKEGKPRKPLNGSNLNSGPVPTGSLGNYGVPPDPKLDLKKGKGSLNPSIFTPPRPASRISSTAEDTNRPPDRVSEYLIVEAEFDVVPSISHLATQPNLRNVICFVKSLATFEPLVVLLEKMVTKPVFFIKNNASLSDSIKAALKSSHGCLILCDMYSQLPTSLKGKPISLNIHFGWVDNLPTYQNQIQKAGSTVILLRRELQPPNGAEILASLSRAGVIQADTATKRRYNRQSDDSALALGRRLWTELLSISTSVQSVRSAYVAWITHHYHGRHKETEWTAVNVATHANRYFKGLFRYGSGGDVIQVRPTVSQGFVKHLGLEAAVGAGLLTVKS